MRFYTASKLGSKRARTPEGYLVCLDVPIARTGEMLYAPGEIAGLLPGKDGLIRVRREPEDVFDPSSLASFVAKPTTNDHPDEMVTAENWRRYATGSGQNVRQGEGNQADLVLADLIWTDPQTIKDIEGGKDEISNGYDADYEEIEPGVYRQMSIVGNHIALVDSGRCGSRCSIGDSAAALQTTIAAATALTKTSTVSAPSCGCGGHTPHRDAAPPAAKPARKRKTRDMSKPMKLRGSMLDRVRRAFSAKDEAGFEEAMTAVESAAEESEAAEEKAEFASMIGEAVASAIAPVIERLDVVEASTADLKKTRDDEAAAKTAAEKEAAENAEKDEAERKAAEAAAAEKETKDNEALAAFLKAKGLSDEDVAEACKMLAAEKPASDSLEQPPQQEVASEANPDTPDGDPDAGATAPLYNAGASSQLTKSETGDSAGLVAEFRDTIARAEILAPGIKLPTFDAKAKAKATSDAVCALRRDALKRALDSADRKKIVAPFVTDAAALGKMSCDVVRMAFVGASEAAKVANKPAPTFDAIAPASGAIKNMNDRAKALWG